MNKMIKGSVAGATGIVLLMGGFGTYALWSDSKQLNGSSVSSGELYIQRGTVAWADQAGAWNPAGDLVVPGDTITRTQTFTVKGTGKNLTGTIDFAQGALDTSEFGDWLDVTVAITESPDNVTITPGTEANDFVFSAPFGEATLTAVVTYDFDENTPAMDAQAATATLGNSTITIAQN
jgi:alternate signal-mediated exported protein